MAVSVGWAGRGSSHKVHNTTQASVFLATQSHTQLFGNRWLSYILLNAGPPPTRPRSLPVLIAPATHYSASAHASRPHHSLAHHTLSRPITLYSVPSHQVSPRHTLSRPTPPRPAPLHAALHSSCVTAYRIAGSHNHPQRASLWCNSPRHDQHNNLRQEPKHLYHCANTCASLTMGWGWHSKISRSFITLGSVTISGQAVNSRSPSLGCVAPRWATLSVCVYV